MARTRRCKGTNKAGKRCAARPQKGRDHCRAHDPELAEGERFGSKEQASAAAAAGAGRPRKPSPSALLRERIEADIEQLLAPYLDALVAVRGEGEPDHGTRMRAAREVFDRVYGKPRKEGEPAPDEIAGGDEQLLVALEAFLFRLGFREEPFRELGYDLARAHYSAVQRNAKPGTDPDFVFVYGKIREREAKLAIAWAKERGGKRPPAPPWRKPSRSDSAGRQRPPG